jgi:hypothetical protein
VRSVSTSNVDFFQDDIKKAQEVFPDKIEASHTDGVFHRPDNQQYCKDNEINLYLHAIQGAKSRYQFNFTENGELSIFDTVTNAIIENKKIICKNGIEKWRIKTEKAYRYITQKDIDGFLIRKQIAETPIEILQFRNNVEATIFQLGYHYSNAKSRYRGEVKHQMWANIRCMWVNFVRIMKILLSNIIFYLSHQFFHLIKALYDEKNNFCFEVVFCNYLDNFTYTILYLRFLRDDRFRIYC